ncbi:MAG: Ldh family oxidoreductase, partial [Chloroflexi bacterium]|nr:Ldh family oxidoreductase [Chloroflexota bacterium]
MLKWLSNLAGDSNERDLSRLEPVVKAINELEPKFEGLSDEQLKAKTGEFKGRLEGGEALDFLLPEAFAAVREAAKRTLKQRHFDVQLMGGMVLHGGKIAEMKTGEGKTLVATLAVYLNALTSRGVHVVTVNDYLARRDTQWMGPIYHLLGASIACLQHEVAYLFDPDSGAEDPHLQNLTGVGRRQAYEADITYGTNNEFGFDYLRDNMAADLSRTVQREIHYAIVDEVDNILIDEARTPLIISGQAEESTKLYHTFARLVPTLIQEKDYTVDEQHRSVSLTPEGFTKVEKALQIPNLYDPQYYALTHYLDNALRAHAMFKRDGHYVVKDGEAIIVDEFTGRLMAGRRYSDGLHQAIEAKEGLSVQRESITLATITLQNYFRLYEKLAGMTGTAVTEAEEFYKIYKLDVVVIPTHLPMIREEFPDQIYKSEGGKFKALVKDLKELQESGRPVLAGTTSVEKSEQLSQMLTRGGVTHQVLNGLGVPLNDASTAADVLGQANLRGVDTHGIGLLPGYVSRIKQGMVKTKPRIKVLKEGVATMVIDADQSLGQISSRFAMQQAINKALLAGIGWVNVVNSNHHGALAYYALMAAEQEMIGIVSTTTSSCMAPWGSREPLVGNNPLAIAVPCNDHEPLVLDMATSLLASGGVRSRRIGIPEGLSIDSQGNPNSDPDRSAALLPAGGYKGS